MPSAYKTASLALLLLLGAAARALPQPPPGARGPQDRAGKLAQYYETIASRTLSRYYEEATYLVKAKVELEPPPEFEPGGDDPEAVAGEAPQQLPGLPFLPENAQPSAPVPSASGADKAPGGIQAVTLDILVDTGYSEKDAEFIRNLLAMAARLDDSRGDRVSVHEGVFPRDNRALTGYRKPVDPPPAPPAQAPPRNDSSAKKEDAKEKAAAANPFGAYTEHLPSLIPLLLICLLILACVWMVSRAIAGSSRNGKQEPVLPPALAPALPAPAAARPDAGKAPPSELAAFRPFLLNCFVGSPKHCGQILKSWIQRDPDKGMRDSAALVASLDPRMVGVLASELGRDLSQKLEMHLTAGEAPAPEEMLTLCKEFKREYQNLANGHMDEDQYKDLFGFLLQMNEQQIMHILRDESLGIVGLVLAQLPGETAGAILQRTDPDNRAKLLIAMGNIDHIPLNVYKEIADRLSLKALEVGNMRYVAADGVDSILELIDSLPLHLQFQYIHSISEMDLGLGEKLRNRYVTLPEVVGLPDKFLANVLQGLDQETLILAILHVDEAVRSKVLSLLPERMQMMVAGGLEGPQNATPKDSETAQRRLLHRIRDEIRHSGRPV
ncbi:MAG TPA: FliG C-terminal domain-containing protein [Fibrobacteria bacterium]|nr:FliG C-terminal domain-containing protein [Fibrobacteria bacterium]